MPGLFIVVLLALIGGAILVVAGAIMGIIAKRRTEELHRRLVEAERRLRQLERAASQPAALSAPPLRPSSPPTAASAAGSPPPPASAAGGAAAAPAAVLADRHAATPPEPEPPAEPPSAPAAPGEPAAAPSAPAPALPPAAGQADAAPRPAASLGPQPGSLAGVEAILGLRWLTWVGVGLLFLGIAFFLKYAYDRDWLGHFFGPRLRIATATALALALAVAGWRSLGRGMIALGQGLLGGGQALLYLTIFAAFQPAMLVVPAPLIGTSTAFILMAVVTAAGLTAAVRRDAIAMAFIAVLGGIAAPVLVSSGQDAREALFAYLLLLDLGVLGVALHRRWRMLDLLAFAGTVLLFVGWFATWHHRHAQPDLPTLAWLCAFHLVFLLLPFAHHWRHRSAITVERFALALANLAWTLGYAAWMLHERAPLLLALGCLAGAALYLALALATVRRLGEDRRTRDGFLALAALQLTLGLFYLLPVDGITTAWFVEAAVLLWLGYRFAHVQTRWAALAVLAVALARTLAVHLPDADVSAAFLANRWFIALAVAALGLAGFALVHRQHGASGAERTLARCCGHGSALWLLLAGTLEILRHADGHAAAWTAVSPAMAITWLQLAGTAGLLAWAGRHASQATLLTALLPLAAAVVAASAAYARYPAEALPLLNGCGFGAAAICAALILAGATARRIAAAELAASLFGMAQLALVASASVEALAWMQRGEARPAASTLTQTLAWIWVLAGIAGSLLAQAWLSRRVLILAAIPLLLGLATCLGLYLHRLDPHLLAANQRFLLGALACAAVAWMGTVARRLQAAPAAPGGGAIPGIALALMGAFAIAESVSWSHAAFDGDAASGWTAWLLGLSAVLIALGGWWRHRATGNQGLRSVALLALAAGLVLPLAVFLTAWRAGLMFLNLRCGLLAAAIAVAVLWSQGSGLAWLRWLAFAAALLGLSAEPPAWLLEHIADRAEAGRMALFSVTVVWLLIASTLLGLGFARDRRSLRLIALGLFALTAAKLLILDMSGAQQLYRILAFVLVGLVFVGASWLYHRVGHRASRGRRPHP